MHLSMRVEELPIYYSNANFHGKDYLEQIVYENVESGIKGEEVNYCQAPLRNQRE